MERAKRQAAARLTAEEEAHLVLKEFTECIKDVDNICDDGFREPEPPSPPLLPLADDTYELDMGYIPSRRRRAGALADNNTLIRSFTEFYEEDFQKFSALLEPTEELWDEYVDALSDLD